MAASPDLPLTGVRVIDLGQIYNGPYATVLMALAGATVIKVEPPRGDLLRGRNGLVGGSTPFLMLNSNKKSITLNLKDARGRELLNRLVSEADVLVENFRPGVMDRLRIGPKTLMAANPRLIYACSPGYGSTGPYRDFAAMDLTVQAMVGMMSITGFPSAPPVKAGAAVCDFMAGIHLYGAITTALYQRSVTGVGNYVEASMFEAAVPSLMSGLGLQYALPEGAPPVNRVGNRHPGNAEAPYDVYPTADSYLAIICVSEAHWAQLVDVMGRPELLNDPRFTDRRTRTAHIDEMDDYVRGWTTTLTTAQAAEALNERGVPCAPVRTLDEIVTDPHLIERGLLQNIEHPDLGPVPAFASPLRYGADVSTARAPLPSPNLGEHNDEIYRGELGLSDTELGQLRTDGVI
jgi:crotonobetainyl-CoA:carnitine CoA-transferase CaiB-like acyl-CoA transferase